MGVGFGKWDSLCTPIPNTTDVLGARHAGEVLVWGAPVVLKVKLHGVEEESPESALAELQAPQLGGRYPAGVGDVQPHHPDAGSLAEYNVGGLGIPQDVGLAWMTRNCGSSVMRKGPEGDNAFSAPGHPLPGRKRGQPQDPPGG